MADHETYIHGTQPSEQERLARLNRLTNAAFLDFLNVEPGMHVLDVGSGLGLLACEIAAADSSVRVVGVEQSSAQIAAAASHPNVRYLQADAHALDLPGQSFDLVYSRYVLEHVADPVTVLREMRRVAKNSARVLACENDISLMRMDPPCPTFETVWRRFAEYQSRLGGDAYVGRRLHRIFRAAGFTRIELSVQPELHWHGSPGFAGWIRNVIGNVESAREGLVRNGVCQTNQINEAEWELETLIANADASSLFVWNRAAGVR